MSGSYQELDVPPTLISFAVCPNKTHKIKSATLQSNNSKLSVFIPNLTDDLLLDENNLKSVFDCIQINNSNIISSATVKFGGLAETIALMSFGNEIGVEVETTLDLMKFYPAAIVIEHSDDLEISNDLKDNFYELGKTNASKELKFNEVSISMNEILTEWKSTFSNLFQIGRASCRERVSTSGEDRAAT